MKKLRDSSQFSSLFLLYIFTAKPFSLGKDKQTRNLVSFDSANFEMSEIYQGNFQSLCRLAQLFLETSVLRKKSEIVGNFFQL